MFCRLHGVIHNYYYCYLELWSFRWLGIILLSEFQKTFFGLIFLWLTFFNIDFPVLWGLLAFMLNFVPNVGSIIAAIPAILIAIIQLGFMDAGIILLGYVAVNITLGSLLEPRLLGKGLGLSPLIVFLSLVFWGWVLGPVGMLLSVPLTMIAKIAMENNEGTKWISILMGSESEI